MVRRKIGKVPTHSKPLRIVYFLPLSLLFLERLWFPFRSALSGSEYFELERATVTRKSKNLKVLKQVQIPSLSEITNSAVDWLPCPAETMLMGSQMRSQGETTASDNHNRSIPMIVHQTARTRCLTPTFHAACSKWKLPGYEYWFHDDKAVNRLLRLNFPEFPLLHNLLRNCVTKKEKITLWQYLVVYAYGGIVAPFGSEPNIKQWNDDVIYKHGDAFIVAESDSPSLKGFMAASPRHPFVYYSIQHFLLAIFDQKGSSHPQSDNETSLAAFERALHDYKKDAGLEFQQKVFGQAIVGTTNSTLTIFEMAKESENLFLSLAVDPVVRRKDYGTMGMSDLLDINRPKPACIAAILRDVVA